MAQYYCAVVPVLHVPPGAFKPPPKVDSAVVRLIPHSQPPVEVTSVTLLEKVCSAAFNQRRKTIRNSLGDWVSEEELVALGLSPAARAETLSLTDFAAVANLVANRDGEC